MRDLTTIVNYLAEQGHKASHKKAQLAKQELTYLGVSISKGTKHITHNPVETMSYLARPNTHRTLRNTLGLFNFVRHFIPSYSKLKKGTRTSEPSFLQVHGNSRIK